MRKLAFVAALALGLAAFLALAGAQTVERLLNGPAGAGPRPGSADARALVASAEPVDLHADPLLWGRDLLVRGTRGQVDVPRLLEAGEALQVFGVVTQAPWRMRMTGNALGDLDLVRALATISRWPRPTWTSRRERALFQAQRLRDLCAQSQGALACVRTRGELDAVLAARKAGVKTVGALLALEGSLALEGDLRSIDALYDAGFRMIAPTHFTDTEISGSAHGTSGAGLSPLGVQWLARLEEKRIVVDLAHASPRTFDDVLARATRPLVVSHTGVKGTCDNPRNLSDAQLRAVARNGGVVGIGYFKAATCKSDAQGIARAARYAADIMGVAHVALGSDFDGAVRTPFDVTGLPLLVDALRAESFSDDDLRAVLGGNALRVLRAVLP